MKNRIIISLFLLAVFCAAPVFAQLQQSDLITEIIKFNNIKIPKDKCYGDSCKLDEKTKKFLAFFQPALSKRGSIEVDSRSQSLIFTDTKNRIKLIENISKIIDNSGFTLELFTSGFSNNEQTYIKTVKSSILPLRWCGNDAELKNQPVWTAKQGRILIKILKLLNVSIEMTDGIKITGAEKNVNLAENIVNLFSMPYLIEEID